MRSHWFVVLLALLGAACAAPARIVRTADGADVSVGAAADDLAAADVVALGELHQTPAVHETHLDLIQALHSRRPQLVIAMEMFERDVQTTLLQYLTGAIDEGDFLAASRPWPDYRRDYRPVVEYAKANGIVVLAANAPRKLAAKVAREGAAAVAGEANVARETTAPEDAYYAEFVKAMDGHPGVTREFLGRMYAAQCIKDDTMAESITDYLASLPVGESKPLVVLVCGRMHSDHGRGTVQRIKNRRPDLDCRVLSAETVKEPSSDPFTSPKDVGSYVVVTAEVERPPMMVGPVIGSEKDKGAAKGPDARLVEPKTAEAKPTAGQPAAAAPAVPAHDENVRPALGLMPEYGGEEGGVKVGSVREGGAADKAGIEAGDLLVALNGTAIKDIEHYTELLDALTIGKAATVRVRREGAEVDLQVVVGSRPRSR
ncbi:MAG: ChaN family lipoprotein [Planctomycetota bacterium]|jgi:uncharacterized iron-regulated protein